MIKPYRIVPSVWVPGRYVVKKFGKRGYKLATPMRFATIFEAMTYICLLELSQPVSLATLRMN